MEQVNLGTGSGIEARSLAGGRASRDAASSLSFGFARSVIAPPDAEGHWRAYDLDAETLSRHSPARLMELLADLSPDVSRALWDFLRLFNPGWEAKALKPGSDEIDKAGQDALDGVLATLKRLYGSCDVVWGRLALGAFLRGAFVGELVLDANGIEAVDLATPDPFALRFRKRQDELRGIVWQLCQWQEGELVDLDRITIQYVPVDPFPSSPYGRPIAAPALFTSLFALGLLHDLRRVVAQQGYPRLDLEIDFEQVIDLVKQEPEDGRNALQVVAAIAEDVRRSYAELEPDDAYVHPSLVKVNRPVGAVDASALGGIDGLIRALERMAVRALKTMPLLMGNNEATSETHANRQWEVMAAGIKSLQHTCESLLEHLLGVALEAQGIKATVEFRFAELRASELMRDAMTQTTVQTNAAFAYAQGWISQEAAAEIAVGHAPDVPEPRQIATPTNAPQPPPISELSKRVRETVEPEGSDQPLLPVPVSVDISDEDRAMAWDAWDELMPERFAGIWDAEVIEADEE